MSINRTIATASAIAAISLVACNDSADKMDGSMTPSSSAMMMEESK